MKPMRGCDQDVQGRGHDNYKGLSPKEACRDTLEVTKAPYAGEQGTRGRLLRREK